MSNFDSIFPPQISRPWLICIQNIKRNIFRRIMSSWKLKIWAKTRRNYNEIIIFGLQVIKSSSEIMSKWSWNKVEISEFHYSFVLIWLISWVFKMTLGPFMRGKINRDLNKSRTKRLYIRYCSKLVVIRREHSYKLLKNSIKQMITSCCRF